jgi:hypothetical protein
MHKSSRSGQIRPDPADRWSALVAAAGWSAEAATSGWSRQVGVELVDGEAAAGVDLAQRSRPSSAGQGEAEDEAATCRTWERRRAAAWELAIGVGKEPGGGWFGAREEWKLGFHRQIDALIYQGTDPGPILLFWKVFFLNSHCESPGSM